MKKAIIIVCSLGGFMLFGFIAARLTHLIDVYQCSNAAMQPTYFPGSIIMASRLKTPDRNTLICFNEPKSKAVWILRCIGKGGDKVEIKKAAVYLNGKLLEEPYTWNEYYISRKQLTTIQGYVDNYKYPLNPVNDSLSTITFSAADAAKYHLDLKLSTANKGVADEYMFSDFIRANYNVDNLGPLIVPKNSYFLMGDNRHDVMDSRHIGFVKKDAIISTVIQ
jgi:signal peptidase I